MLVQEQIFSASPPSAPCRRAAANKSLATGRPVRIADLADPRPGARRLDELV